MPKNEGLVFFFVIGCVTTVLAGFLCYFFSSLLPRPVEEQVQLGLGGPLAEMEPLLEVPLPPLYVEVVNDLFRLLKHIHP